MVLFRRVLAGSLVVLSAAAPADARSARDTVRVMQGLASQSGNQKVLDAMKTLKEEGFLDKVGAALAEDDGAPAETPAAAQPLPARSAPAAQSQAPSGGGGAVDATQAKQIALDYAKKNLGSSGAGAIVSGEPKESKGSKHTFKVNIIPGNKAGVLVFFMHYVVEVDANSGQVLSMK